MQSIPVPGLQAYVVLMLFPLVVIALFRKLPLQQALIWSIVSGYLLLPAALVVNFNLPILPTLDKNFIPALFALIMCLAARRTPAKHKHFRRQGQEVQQIETTVLKGWLPRSPLGMGLIMLMLIGAGLTVLTNADTLNYGPRVLPGQTLYDAFSVALNSIVLILPLLLGRKFLADDAGHTALLKIICIAALAYSLLALFEIRMSPQLNNIVYGFFPHSFAQHIRAEGFRPLVFLDHGLLLAIFMASSIMATAILVRMSRGAVQLSYSLALLYLVLVLVLSKSAGGLIIALLLLPVALLFPVRIQLVVAGIIAVITLTYPVLRGTDTIPTEEIVDYVRGINETRASSLGFRFDNEDLLLEKASERPVFGWSGWGRSRVYDENGYDLSVTDGEWVITIGEYGWVGYIARFGLFCFPLIVLALRRKRYNAGLVTAGLALAIGANLIDLLPNASPSPIIWLAAGALLGRLELQRAPVSEQVPQKSTPLQREPFRPTNLPVEPATLAPDLSATRYSRFPHHNHRHK